MSIADECEWRPPKTAEVGRLDDGDDGLLIIETYPEYPKHVGIAWIENKDAGLVIDGVTEWMCSMHSMSFTREQWERIKALVDGAFT